MATYNIYPLIYPQSQSCKKCVVHFNSRPCETTRTCVLHDRKVQCSPHPVSSFSLPNPRRSLRGATKIAATLLIAMASRIRLQKQRIKSLRSHCSFRLNALPHHLVGGTKSCKNLGTRFGQHWASSWKAQALG